MYMDVSQNRGKPPNHPFVHRLFHYFHHPFWDTFPPIFGSTSIYTNCITPEWSSIKCRSFSFRKCRFQVPFKLYIIWESLDRPANQRVAPDLPIRLAEVSRGHFIWWGVKRGVLKTVQTTKNLCFFVDFWECPKSWHFFTLRGKKSLTWEWKIIRNFSNRRYIFKWWCKSGVLFCHFFWCTYGHGPKSKFQGGSKSLWS